MGWIQSDTDALERVCSSGETLESGRGAMRRKRKSTEEGSDHWHLRVGEGGI